MFSPVVEKNNDILESLNFGDIHLILKLNK